MKAFIEFLAVGAIGLAVAFTANAVRGSGSIKLSKNYFDTGLDGADGTNGAAAPSEKHEYQQISFDEISDLLADPLTPDGVNVFIDARNEEQFAEGHIPFAWLCNPYEADRYYDQLFDRMIAAEKVVVYCGGGDCADSKFMCREFLEWGVEYDRLFLYAGGWKDWTANGGAIDVGEP